MVNFSTLSASLSPRSAGNTSGNNGTTTTTSSSVEDEKANAKQTQSREETVRSMSSEANPFDLDNNNDNDSESASKASPVVNPFDLDGTKKEEQGPANNNTGSGSQAQTLTAPNDDIEEVFMVDVPAAEGVKPPSWMTGASSVGGGASNTGRAAASLPPPGRVFDYFHQEEQLQHDRPSESSLSAAAAGEGSSEKQSSKKKKKKKKSGSSSRSKSGTSVGDDQTLLTLASSASTANPDGSRKGTNHRDDYEVMLEAMDRTTSSGKAHHRRRSSHAGGDSGSVVSTSSHTSGRSSVTSRSSRRRRGKMSSDHTVLPIPPASSDGGDLLNLHGSFSSASSPKVVLTSSHDEQDGDSDDSAYEYVAGGIISSDNTATAQSIMDMSSRGEVLSDVQIHHPQAQIEEVDAPDAAAGGAAVVAEAAAVDVRKMESFGQGGRKSSKAGKALANFAEGPDDRGEDNFAGIDGLEAPSQGDMNEAKMSRDQIHIMSHDKSSGKDHKHSKRHRYTRSRGDRRKKGEDYNGLALDEETASIAEKLHFGWGRNEMDTGGGATDVPSPEMVSKVGLATPSVHSQDTTSRSSSIASSSAAIEAIKKLGKSVARRVSAPDARYLQIDVTNGKAIVGQSKSTSPSRVGSISSRSNEDMEAAAANFLFDDHEIKDYDTAQAELNAKKKQRARLSKSQWGDGTRRASYDGFNDDVDVHEEGFSNDGAPRRTSAARAGPITSWAFLAERYAPRSNFSDKKKRRRLDDDGIIDDEDLNDNRDAPLPQGHGDLDVMGWTTPFFERKKRRQRIFWATTGIVIGLAFLIGGIMIANGRKQAPDGTVSDSSVGAGKPGGTGGRPGEDGTPVFNGPNDSGWQDTPEGNLDGKPRDPAPPRPSPPPPVETARPLETPESNTGTTQSPGTLGGKHALSDSDVKKILAQVTPESILLDPTSPQYSAMEWLLDDIDTSLIYFAGSGPSDRIIQRYTLAVIYHATGGPWGAWETDELWLTEEDECEWFGVRCGTNGETEEVVMQQPEGSGRLRRGAEINTPQDIVQSQVLWDENAMLSEESSFVTFLDLSSNGLQGVIPEEIGTLWKLEQLLLFDNKIGKTIPWEYLTKLQSLHTLYLDRNKLTGIIPNSIGQLSNMKNLDLSNNKLSSTLPNALGNLVNLVVSDTRTSRPFHLNVIIILSFNLTFPSFFSSPLSSYFAFPLCRIFDLAKMISPENFPSRLLASLG